jgi:hypothetical protein
MIHLSMTAAMAQNDTIRFMKLPPKCAGHRPALRDHGVDGRGGWHG